MAKEKISQYSSNPADNTDVGGISIAENCSPANINNAIRQVMAQLKEWQDGSSDDPLVVDGLLTVNGDANFTGKTTAVTALANDNSTTVATTAYVDRETGALGTIATQNADAVAITGGTIDGTTKTGQGNNITMAEIGTNAVGKKTVSSLSPSGGVDGDIWYKV